MHYISKLGTHILHVSYLSLVHCCVGTTPIVQDHIWDRWNIFLCVFQQARHSVKSPPENQYQTHMSMVPKLNQIQFIQLSKHIVFDEGINSSREELSCVLFVALLLNNSSFCVEHNTHKKVVIPLYIIYSYLCYKEYFHLSK